MRCLLKNILMCSLICFDSTVYAEPWFTGPLLAPPAETIPRGHANLELYGDYLPSNAIYNNHWQSTPTIASKSIQITPQFTYGLTDQMDIEWMPLYENNRVGNKTKSGMGDTSVTLGFQLMKQTEHTLRPDLRLTLQEILPSGRFDRLNEANEGADITGIGSYQTALGFNFQHLLPLGQTFFLNTHISFTYLYASEVLLHGLNAYGGNILTQGRIKPGNLFSLDLAEELSLTQNWVAVLEGLFQYQEASSFKGLLGQFEGTQVNPNKRVEIKKRLRAFLPSRYNISGLSLDNLHVGNGVADAFSLAPAIEYNFSNNYGVILGSWFTVSGKNTPNFASLVVAWNAYW